ncbi:unnamed protein product [Spirodela intermedia]|uniref:Uncharacterized protein n=1 Tax=Spirodela intermedia TaxID=51605 RepID=A0A7I8I870_SPIIN|nr:unnamed protein product [Spirodela intermedia]CAA6653770.1 unnamed protein product [Spirodela intermedia]
MEVSGSPSGSLNQASLRRASSSCSLKDIWSAAREGSLSELDSSLSLLKKNGGNVDAKNAFGLTALHIATWRNHVPIVKRLLSAGADPDVRDGESGWSSLHRALHFGHLAVAGILLQSGATLTLEDSKFQTPVDLISGPVLLGVGKDYHSVATEIYSWGSGTNYQLGTGNAHIQRLPCKVDALQGSYIKMSAAAKFHSVAVGSCGELYTWGFGRGGRLGHPDFDIHSGQAAVITPRQVTMGLGSRRVMAIAAAKHHTVIATESGEVFTWGSNREGQLGYPSVDTQPTPRRVSSLRSRIIAVAAANKHTAAVAESGEVFTWGCNKEGQLGYGTSNSASNYTPRLVEYLKGRNFKAVSVAKYHTVVLGADGEVFTWGHRLVNPRRVIIARNTRKGGCVPLVFHRTGRLHVVAIAAGMVHTTALADDGSLFYWPSSDPELRCQQMYSLQGRDVVSISAGKYWTVASTKMGDVYMLDGKRYKDETPIPTRLNGIKNATSASVGETHMLVVCALYHPPYRFDADFMFDDPRPESEMGEDELISKPIPSLKSLCEKVAAEVLVEPRNAIPLLEIADSLEANDLRAHCEEMAIRNLSYIFTVSAPSVASASSEVLAKLERAMDAKSSEPWSHRRLPTPLPPFPLVRENDSKLVGKLHRDPWLDAFLPSDSAADSEVTKRVRAVWKKLQQIEILEAKQSNGHVLDDQQIAKLQSRPLLKSALADLGFPLEMVQEPSPSLPADGKGRKKTGASRRCPGEPVQEEEEQEGGLSMFLSGALDDSSKGAAPPPPLPLPLLPKSEGPAWGGAKVSKGAASLRDIQDEQSRTSADRPGNKKLEAGPVEIGDPGKIQLSSLLPVAALSSPIPVSSARLAAPSRPIPVSSARLVAAPSSPIPVSPARLAAAPEGERSTPPWSSSGSSPTLSRPSLRDIQMQQQQQQCMAHSPKLRTSGFAAAPPGGAGSPSESAASRWFKPEADAPSSIRSIQIEEEAMKNLKRFYSTVKLVKPHPHA